MPLFVFISGALFYKECSKEKIKIEDIINKKFKRLIIPYIAYGILYTIPMKLFARYYTLKVIPYAIINETLLGKNIIQHIWYLPTLFFITILFFIIYNCIMKKDTKRLCIFLLILSLFCQEIEITFPGIKYLPILFIFFSLGAIFEENRIKIEEKLKYKSFMFLFIICIIPLLYKLDETINIVYISSLINCILILSIIVAIIFISYAICKVKPIINSKIFKLINKYSFDIYILGDPLNYIVLLLVSLLGLTHMYQTIKGTIALILTRTIGIMIVTIIMSIIISKIKKMKYFNKVIKVILTLFIILSMSIIMYNKVNNIEIGRTIYEVIEENYE